MQNFNYLIYVQPVKWTKNKNKQKNEPAYLAKMVGKQCLS